MLVWAEKFLLNTPWPIILGGIVLIARFGSRSWKITMMTLATMLLIGYFDIWDNTMSEAEVQAVNATDDDSKVVGHLDLESTVAAIVKQERRHTTSDGKYSA